MPGAVLSATCWRAQRTQHSARHRRHFGTALGTRHSGTQHIPRVLIADLRTQFTADLAAVRTDADLKALRDKYLGRKGGAVAGLMKALGAASPDERPALGQQINELKQHIETALDERLAALASTRRPAGAVDVTLPAGCPRSGGSIR